MISGCISNNLNMVIPSLMHYLHLFYKKTVKILYVACKSSYSISQLQYIAGYTVAVANFDVIQ